MVARAQHLGTDLVFHAKLDSTTAGVFPDEIGGNTAILNDPSPVFVAGIDGNAWDCNNPASIIYRAMWTPTSETVGLGLATRQGVLNSAHSVSMWMNIRELNGNDGYSAFLGLGTNAIDECNSEVWLDFPKPFMVGEACIGAASRFVFQDVLNLKWYLITSATDPYSGSTCVYLNATLQGCYTGTFSATSGKFYLGGGLTGLQSGVTHAYMDDPHVWSRYLGDAEVIEHYNQYIFCGNGVCELDQRETPDNCPADCDLFETRLFLGKELILHWDFEDNSNPALAIDQSGVGNDGTVTSAATWNQAGVGSGKAIYFDGSNYGALRLGADVSGLIFNSMGHPSPTAAATSGRGLHIPFTISMWIKISAVPSSLQMLFQFGEYSGAPGLYIKPVSGSARIGYVSQGIVTVDSTGVVPLNTWTHVVMRSSGATCVFVDGVKKLSDSNRVTLRSDMVNTIMLAGLYEYASPSAFQGHIDEVRVWRRSLDDEEIAVLAACGSDTSACAGPYITVDELECGDGVRVAPAEECDSTDASCVQSTCKCANGYAAQPTGNTCRPVLCEEFLDSTTCTDTNKLPDCLWCTFSSKSLCSSTCDLPTATGVTASLAGSTATCSYTTVVPDPDSALGSVSVEWSIMGTNNGAWIAGSNTINVADAMDRGAWARCRVTVCDDRDVCGNPVASATIPLLADAPTRFVYTRDGTTQLPNSADSLLADDYRRVFTVVQPDAPGLCSFFGASAQPATITDNGDPAKATTLAVVQTPTPGICAMYLGLSFYSSSSQYIWDANGKPVDSSFSSLLPATPPSENCVCVHNDGTWHESACGLELPLLCEVPAEPAEIVVKSQPAEWAPATHAAISCALAENVQTEHDRGHISKILAGSEFQAIWIGVEWSGSAWVWASTGSAVEGTIPWASGEPKSNPETNKFAAATANGLWATFSATELLPALCEKPFVTLTPAAATQIASYTVGFQNVPAGLTYTLFLANPFSGTTYQTTTSGSTQMTVGQIFSVLVKGSTSWHSESSWMRAHCDCVDFSGDGAPTISGWVQDINTGTVTVSWIAESPCTASVITELWSIFGIEANETAVGNGCSGSSQTSQLALSGFEASGSSVDICAFSMRPENAGNSWQPYKSAETCVEHIVEDSDLFGTITLLNPPNGSAPVSQTLVLEWSPLETPTDGSTATYTVLVTNLATGVTTPNPVDKSDVSLELIGLTKGALHSWAIRAQTEHHKLTTDLSFFTPCEATAPSSASLIWPTAADDQPAVLSDSATFQWSLSSPGDTCGMGSTVEFRVLLSRSDTFSTIVANISTVSTQVSVSNLDEGIHFWKVIAANAAESIVGTSESNTASFDVCHQSGPAPPSLLAPLDEAFVKKAELPVFDVGVPSTMGRLCRNGSSNAGFRLFIGPDTTQMWANSVKLALDTETTMVGITEAIRFSGLSLTHGTMQWTASVTNEDGLEALGAETRQVVVCDSPTGVDLLSPADGSINVDIGTTLIWTKAEAALWGYPCASNTGESAHASIYIYPASSTWNNSTKPFVTLPKQIGMDRVTLATNESLLLEVNTLYAWRVGLHNGFEETVSAPMSFRTALKDCRKLICLNGGTCDELEVICVCTSRWTGPDCSIPVNASSSEKSETEETRQSNNGAGDLSASSNPGNGGGSNIMAIALAAGIPALAVIAGIVALSVCLAKRRSNREDKIEMVEIEKLVKCSPDTIDFSQGGRDMCRVGELSGCSFALTNLTDKRFTIEFKPRPSYKWEITFDPPTLTLEPNEENAAGICQLKLLCTTVMSGVGVPMLVQGNEIGQLWVSAEGALSAMLDRDEIVLERSLGSGSYATVHVGKWRGTTVAVKVFREHLFDIKELAADVRREVDLCMNLRHPNIIQYFGAAISKTTACIVMELATNGSLGDAIKEHKLTVAAKFRMAHDVASGMLFLHMSRIIHRDLKPDNVLLMSLDLNAPVCGKLSDFGTSRVIGSNDDARTYTKGVGTPVFCAPEVLDGQKYSSAADVYSFSMLLWNLFSEITPYSDVEGTYAMIKMVLEGTRPQIADNIPEEIRPMIEGTWQTKPEERAEFAAIVPELERIMVANGMMPAHMARGAAPPPPPADDDEDYIAPPPPPLPVEDA